MSRPQEIYYLQGGFSTGKASSFPTPRSIQTKRDRKLQFCTVKMAVVWKAALVQAEALMLWIAKVLKPALLWEILLKCSNLQQKSIWYKSKGMIPLRSNVGLLLASRKVQHRGSATSNTSELQLQLLLTSRLWCASLKRVEVLNSIHCP